MTIDTNPTAGAEQREMQERESERWRFVPVMALEPCASVYEGRRHVADMRRADAEAFVAAMNGAVRASEPQGEDVRTKSGRRVRDIEHRGWCGIIELPDGHVEHRWNAAGRAAYHCLQEDLDLAAMPRPEPQPADLIGVVERPQYSYDVGDAGSAYLRQLVILPSGERILRDPNEGLPATFRWNDLFNVMIEAALRTAPPFQPDPQGEARGLRRAAKMLEAKDAEWSTSGHWPPSSGQTVWQLIYLLRAAVALAPETDEGRT